MAQCTECGKDIWRFDLVKGVCPDCAVAARQAANLQAETERAALREKEAQMDAAARAITLTTETAHNLPIDRRLDIVTAEVVVGMHLFKDIASAFRDTFGGRSKLMQDGLREARKTALTELRREAHALGADAVIGVDLDYSEISGQGKSMLFLVASGTAVTLARTTG